MVIIITCLDSSPRSILAYLDQQSPESKRSLPQDAKARMRRSVTAVGLILVNDSGNGDPRPRGSGVVVRENGVIVTNLHVILQDNPPQLYKEIYFSLAPDSGATPLRSARYRLRVVEIDRKLDLALLQLLPNDKDKTSSSPLTLPVIEIGDSRALELLDDLVIIGFPEKGGATATLSRGIVEGKDNSEGWIKTDGRLLHGNSGGAAVNADGKLIGIATKVEVDHTQSNTQLGTVGFLRPSHFVQQMLDRLRDKERQDEAIAKTAGTQAQTALSQPVPSRVSVTPVMVKVRGFVKSSADGKPVAGARVGLILPGREVAPETLVSWGGTNAEGYFQLEKPVSPGKYTLRAKVVGDERYAVFNREVEIKPDLSPLVIELQPARKQ
ncbi:MAG: trypsin-like peptidase domain-containing protein [Acidobacteria bacterium]|nr:trypsin-like peptidase domain-containing protein [Acidobacteriota bacterium]